MRVKICGITRSGDAECAVRAGADALGFVFARSSPRFVQPDVARKIIASLPPFVTPVGVFADASVQEILGSIRASGVRVVQIHGDLDPDASGAVPVPVVKAFRVGDGFRLEELGKHPAAAYLLDAFVEGVMGGTGKSFDWSVARSAAKFGRIILAGGLTAENVGAAIGAARPYAVDVSSGVELEPGKKDPEKIAAFCAAVRAAGEKES